MKTLYLVRHAKAEKTFVNIADFDRPLTNRGIHDASRMGSLMKERNITPGRFVTSPAIRALSTAFIFAREMQFHWDRIFLRDEIFEASTNQLLRVISTLDDSDGSVMMFGHNPAFTDTANALTTGSIENLPTAAVLCINFEAQSWREIAPGAGKLISFDTPKDLIK